MNSRVEVKMNVNESDSFVHLGDLIKNTHIIEFNGIRITRYSKQANFARIPQAHYIQMFFQRCFSQANKVN